MTHCRNVFTSICTNLRIVNQILRRLVVKGLNKYTRYVINRLELFKYNTFQTSKKDTIDGKLGEQITKKHEATSKNKQVNVNGFPPPPPPQKNECDEGWNLKPYN